MPHKQPKTLKEAARLANDPAYQASVRDELAGERYREKHEKEYPEDYGGKAHTQAKALEKTYTEVPEPDVQKAIRKYLRGVAGLGK